jgi:prophage regulatory protein
MQSDVQSDYRLLDRADLQARGIKLHRVTLHRLMQAGRFPKAIKLGETRLAWLAHEVDAWIASRAAARDELSDPMTQK